MFIRKLLSSSPPPARLNKLESGKTPEEAGEAYVEQTLGALEVLRFRTSLDRMRRSSDGFQCCYLFCRRTSTDWWQIVGQQA